MRAGQGRLAGKVAIITGASKGTGAVMARQFVAEGARVLLTARSEAQVIEVAAAIGENAIGMRADVSNEADVVHRQNNMLDGDPAASALLGRLAEARGHRRSGGDRALRILS